MLTPEQEAQFHQIFEELGKSLDITKPQYDAAVTSYENVGEWLGRRESTLAHLQPQIGPQGSFLIGTATRSIHEDDDLDVDLVLRLIGKPASWTQEMVKRAVGAELKLHGMFLRMLEPEGRRCWTIRHAEGARFHLDILPAVVRPKFNEIINESLSAAQLEAAEDLVFSITDNTTPDYRTETNIARWLKSNPYGFAIWFEDCASLHAISVKALLEAIKPVPAYQPSKSPLQRIVQILKRHRDIMFNGDEDKPISIIITTLAARAYRKETNILVGLANVLQRFEQSIESRYDARRRRDVRWIGNPVNSSENFADKWPEIPAREEKFYRWLAQVRKDIANITGQRGLHLIREGLSAPFGEKAVNRAISAIGDQAYNDLQAGRTRMAAGTGTLGSVGRTVVPKHTNYGSND